MSLTKLQVWNWALRRIGERTLQSELEDNATADLMREIYDLNRRSLLRSYPWSFCQNTAQLTEISEEPPDYLYTYAKPSDALFITKVIAQNDDVVASWDYDRLRWIGNTDEWEVRRDDKVYSNIPGLIVKYTVDIDDESLFDDIFADALAWRLAQEIAMPITRMPELQTNAANGYIQTMQMARGMDGAQSSTDLAIARDWVHAHRRIRGNPRRT